MSQILTPERSATKQYFRNLASAAVTNAALAYTSIVLAIGLVGTCAYAIYTAKQVREEGPIVVRVDKVGRAEAVNLTWDAYKPMDSDMRYFLIQFVTGFYSRNHHTVQDLYPTSLYFLRQDVFQTVQRGDRETRWMAKLVTNAELPDVNVNVLNVALDRGLEANGQYKAVIDGVKIITTAGNMEQKSVPFVVTCWFESHPELVKENRDLIKHNPLGFLIYNFRADDAFGETKKEGL